MNLKRFNKILAVDDSTANLQLVMNLLSEQGYTVYPASDGELALEFVRSTLPDLILLDIKMPGMDGYEVCRRLKADERVASIPVIFLSALEDEHNKVRGLQAGGVDYITKPFEPEELLARVGIHLRLRELTEGLEQEVNAQTEELTIANRRLQKEIAERKQAEEALRESQQRLDNIVANSPGAIYRCANDEHWTMEFISMGITLISGYPAEDFLNNRGRSYASIIHPDDRQHVVDAVKAGVARKEHFEMEYRLVAADDTTHWVHEQGRGVFSPEGRLLCLDGVIFDITAQREAEETLKLNTERMEALLQLNQMTSATQEEMFSFAFEAAVRLTRSKLGYLGLMNEDDTILNMQLWSREAMAECKVPNTPRIFALENSGLWGEAVRQRRPIITNEYAAPNPWKKGIPEGHVKLLRHMNLPVIVGGKIVLVVGVGNKEEDYNESDVQQLSLLMEGMWGMIERMRAEKELRHYHNQLEETVQQRTEELKLSRDAAEAANRAKSMFLANMSHELRTPLNAILGFSAMLRRDRQATGEQREKLDIINRSGEHLLRLIDDVLEIAKIEAGRLQLEITAFDLGAMVRDVTDLMRLRAEEKGLQLQVDQSSAFPRYIMGDEARLRQILVNLAGNAVKFTRAGSITIRLRLKQNARPHLVIVVEDTGPGISAEDQKRLFKPFVQLGEAGEQKGTGLGLTISRQFAELMGGTIGVTSELGKGSVFCIELPVELADEAGISTLQRPAVADEVAGLAPGTPTYRILIAEDQLENQLLLSQLMSRIGLEVKVAANGEECVKLFEDWHPHLVWMDRRMPVMDGIEATRRIRALPEGRSVRIVAVTASVFTDQQRQMLEAGMDDYVRKPYRIHEIYDCLAEQLDLKYTYESTTEEAAAGPAELKHGMLTVLPGDLCGELKEALESLDSDRINAAIQRVSEIDAKLGRTLSQLAENFDYPVILKALAANAP